MERHEIALLFKALEHLCLIFGRPWTEQLGEAYASALVNEPGDAVLANCRAAARGDKMPLPRDLMASALAGADVSDLDAARAWDLTRPCFARHAEPADPLAAEVVMLLGGSAAIGSKDSDEVGTWIRKEFIRLYQERSKIDRREPLTLKKLPRGGENWRLNAGDFDVDLPS